MTNCMVKVMKTRKIPQNIEKFKNSCRYVTIRLTCKYFLFIVHTSKASNCPVRL